MSQTMKIKDAGSKFRRLIESFREKKEECVIQDEKDRPVAVVLPIERYESYQAYRRQRERDFAILDKVAEDFKDYDPDFIEGQIEKAVAEVKVEAKNKQQAG